MSVVGILQDETDPMVSVMKVRYALLCVCVLRVCVCQLQTKSFPDSCLGFRILPLPLTRVLTTLAGGQGAD